MREEYNILFFHPKNDFTGSTRVLSTIIKQFYSEKRCTVITVNGNGFLSDIPNLNIIDLHKPNINNKIISAISFYFYAIYTTFSIGLHYKYFYINTIIPYYATIIGRLLRKEVIYHIHEKYIIRPMGIKIAEYIFNHTKAKHIYVSQYLSTQYPTRPSCQTQIIYNWLSEDFLKKVKIKRIQERTRKNIIMISSLSKEKGIFTFVELSKKLPEYEFTLIISASHKDIHNYMNIKQPENLKIYPTQPNIHPFLYETDLILNLTIPTFSIETFGMTILEAMSYGIPAIVPNVGGPTELIKDGYNGFCTDVTNLDILSAKIKEILSDTTYTTMAKNAMERSRIFKPQSIYE